MKKGFVQTENYRRLKEAAKSVDKRGAREAGLVIVKGIYGVGKSELTARWAADSKFIFLRAKETWTKRALLDELAETLGLDTRGRNQQVQQRIIVKLGLSMTPLIVDEADFLIRSTPALLEVLRDITDTTGLTCFMVGMEHFPMKVARYGHIASRVAKIVEFAPVSLADVKATVAAKAEVEISDAVVTLIHQQCAGRMRLVLNAIANIEDWAAANGWKTIKPEHVADKPLCTEFTGVQLGRRATAA